MGLIRPTLIFGQISNRFSFLRGRGSRRRNPCFWFKNLYTSVWNFHCFVLIYSALLTKFNFKRRSVKILIVLNPSNLIIILWAGHTSSWTETCVGLKIFKLTWFLYILSGWVSSLMNHLHWVLKFLYRVCSVLIYRFLSRSFSFWIASARV